MNNSRKKVLILTGPGGVGKSTISELLEKRCGFVNIDADQLDTEFFPNGGQWLPENIENLKLAHQKILAEVKRLFENGKNNVVLDYIIFGDYIEFFEMFQKEFGDSLEIKVLFPSKEETIKRDNERECYTTGVERILAVRAEFEHIKDIIGKNSYIDTTGETPLETFEKYFNRNLHNRKEVLFGKKKNRIVKEGYDRIAEKYSIQRDEFKNIAILKRFKTLLPKTSLILDIGCGSGVPIDSYLAKEDHSIIGIDISERQIELARQNLPQGTYEVKDMSDLKVGEYRVDAIVSFYAIFHIPREFHQELFIKFNSFLPLGGLILVTMGSSEWEGGEKFYGVNMYWSHFGVEKNKELIKKVGFEIIFNELDTSGGEEHQIIIAKKIRNIANLPAEDPMGMYSDK